MNVLALVLGLAARLQDADSIGIPHQIESEFERRWAALQEASKTKDLLDHHALACETLANRLAQPDPETLRWLRLPCVLAPRLEGLAPRLLEAHEIVAQQAIEGVRDPVLLRRLLERHAYTQAAKRALEALANRAGDEGRLDEALKIWAADFDRRPTPELAARIALAHARRADQASLLALRAAVAAAKLQGPVRVGGQARELKDLLDGLLKPAPDPPAPAGAALSNELSLGRFEFPHQETYAPDQACALPALGRAGDRDLLVCTNGWRVVALDPSRGEGGSMENAVEWSFPREGAVRSYPRHNPYPGTPPPVGAAIGDGRAYVTMFTRESPPRPNQVGRRPDRNEGPASLRAFDLASGELLWDTETIRIPTADGSRESWAEQARVELQNFCFSGPVLVRSGRLYAAVITSPTTPRYAWVVCLDAATGHPLWTTTVTNTSQTRNGTQLTTIAEEGGTLVVCSNFGVLAALDAETGAFEWLVKYRDAGSPDLRQTASAPMIAGSLIYLLAQDVDELLAFDRWTGRQIPLPMPSEPLPWASFRRLAGRLGDWLLLTGAKNAAYHVGDGRVASLMSVEGDLFGRAAILDGRVYLPTRTALQVYEAPAWKLTQSLPWTEKQGNLLASEGRIFLQTDQVALFSSFAALETRFDPKTGAAAPHGPACRQRAAILEASGRLKEAVPFYRRALKAWAQDPAWQESAEAVRQKLAALEEKLGEEFPKE